MSTVEKNNNEILKVYYSMYIAYSPYLYFDGLVQDCSNSSALAVELLQSCAKMYIPIKLTPRVQALPSGVDRLLTHVGVLPVVTSSTWSLVMESSPAPEKSPFHTETPVQAMSTKVALVSRDVILIG